MKLNEKIMNREKMKAFFQKPEGAIDSTIKICEYDNNPAIVIEFFNEKREPFAFRMEAAGYFTQEELIEIFKVFLGRGGDIRDDWYDIFSRWLKRI